MFSIDPTSSEPIFRQIMAQVEQRVTAGELKEGEAVPSVRQLAETLTINPMTVSKAYNQLESRGLLQRQRGKGMIVGKSLQDPHSLLQPTISKNVEQAKRLRVTKQQLIEWINQSWEEK